MDPVILFLDDMVVRHELFRALAAEHGFEVDSAMTAEDAIRKLERGTYCAVCLDHDLAEDHYSGPYVSPAMGGTAHSGRAVARWVAEHGTPRHVLVHSFNPDGASAIVAALALSYHPLSVNRAPFGPISCRHWLKRLRASL